MIFTPRVIKEIWSVFHQSGRIVPNPDAPSLEMFLQHYAASNAAPGFGWTDRREKSIYQRGVTLTYLYDVTINQLQVTPAVYPVSGEVDVVNDKLWKLFSPRLLAEPVDWPQRWEEAFRDVDLPGMRFITEQGFEPIPPTDWTLLWEKAVKDSNVPVLRFTLERGFDATAVMRRPDWAKMWFQAALEWEIKTLAFMLEQGFEVNTLDEHGRSALFSALELLGGGGEAVVFLVEAGIELGDVEELIQHCSADVIDAGSASQCNGNAYYLRGKAAERVQAAAKDSPQT